MLAAAFFAAGCAGAQTADPTAVAPNPSTTAPVAKSGSYTVTRGTLFAAPGLPLPNGNLPWALDSTGKSPALIPIHHSSITEPAGIENDNVAVDMKHTLDGAHARTVLRTTTPVMFVHTADRTENTGDAGRGNPTGWALVPATAEQGNRVLPHVRFDQVSLGTACAAPIVCLRAETLPDGWLRLSAGAPLAAGDYALIPVPRQARPGILIVYDFTVDPAAPLPKDAVQAVGVTASAKSAGRH